MQLRNAASLTQDPRPDNNWVVKLAQGSRSTDLCLSDSEALIVNLRRAPGGDRVVQKYVSRPVLFKGRKFDLRVLPYFPMFLPLPSHQRSSAIANDSAAYWCSMVCIQCKLLQSGGDEDSSHSPQAAHEEKSVLVQAWD